MKPRSFRPRSTAAHTMWTSGCCRCTSATPGGAATMQTSVTDWAPASFTAAIAAQLQVVLDGLECLLVAVHADETDPRARHEREDAVEHPDARAQDRADRD